jgi:hypothetical protein
LLDLSSRPHECEQVLYAELAVPLSWKMMIRLKFLRQSPQYQRNQIRVLMMWQRAVFKGPSGNGDYGKKAEIC